MLAREGALMVKVVQDAEAANDNTASSSLLDEIVHDGALYLHGLS